MNQIAEQYKVLKGALKAEKHPYVHRSAAGLLVDHTQWKPLYRGARPPGSRASSPCRPCRRPGTAMMSASPDGPPPLPRW